MKRNIFILIFITLRLQTLAQYVPIPVWYKNYTTDIKDVDFSKLVNNASDFSIVKAIDTLSVPETVSILIITNKGKLSQELRLDFASYCGSKKDLIIAGKRAKGKLLLGITDLKGNPVIPLEYLKLRYANYFFALKNQESLWALYDSKGKKITDFVYNDMSFTNYGKIIVKDSSGVGVLNGDGTILIESKYDSIKQLSADSFLVKEQTVWEHLDRLKNVKFQWAADSVKALNDTLYLYYNEGALFIKDSLKRIVGSKTGYQRVERINNKFLKIYNDEYSGLIDFKGKEILPILYYTIEFDEAGYIRALGDAKKVIRFNDIVNKNKKRWSLFDTLGRIIIAKQYKSIRNYKEGVVAIQTDNNLWGFSDADGKVIIEPKYSFATDFKNGLALVKLPNTCENDFLLINKKEQLLSSGKEGQLIYLGVICTRRCEDTLRYEGEPESEIFYGVPPYRYDQYIPAEFGYIRVKNGSYSGMLTPTGKEVVQAYQDTVYLASSDTFFLYKRNNGLIGYSDRYCNTTMELTNRFEEVQPLQDGYSRFKKDGLYGFIDAFGNIQIAPKYSATGEFSDDMAAVFLQGKWGFIDKVENLNVQPYYREVKPFRNGFAPVKNTSNKWLFVDKNGKPINTTLYDSFWETKNEKYIVIKNKKWGITDAKGKEILAPKYEYIEELSDHYLKIKKDGKYGVMDYQENIILYYQYDAVVYDSYLGSFLVKTSGKNQTVVIHQK